MNDFINDLRENITIFAPTVAHVTLKDNDYTIRRIGMKKLVGMIKKMVSEPKVDGYPDLPVFNVTGAFREYYYLNLDEGKEMYRGYNSKGNFNIEHYANVKPFKFKITSSLEFSGIHLLNGIAVDR